MKRINEHAFFMRQAIHKARQGIKQGQTPFGACIVKDGKVIACAHNRVWRATDITAHAEIVAIRQACRKIKSIDLSGAVIYSTCEPCPMCFSACHWARVSKIIYGAGIDDAKRCGFNELCIANSQLKGLAQSRVKIVSGFLREEAVELFQFWVKQKNRKAY